MGWRLAVTILFLALSGCVTCASIDDELAQIFDSYPTLKDPFACQRPGDCVGGYPIARESPRSGTCRMPMNRDAAFDVDRFRSNSRVRELTELARSKQCVTEEPVCAAIRPAGCVYGKCAYEAEGP